MPKKKVLFFLYGGCGGAERMTLTIAKSLPLEKYDVEFVVCGRLKAIFPFIPTDYKINQIRWHNKYCFPHLRISKMIWSKKPDYVFCSTMGLNLLVLQVAKWLKVKAIVRNDNTVNILNKRTIKQMKKRYQYAEYVIAQQEEMASELINVIGLDSDKIVTLHNPIDTLSIDLKSKSPNPYPPNTINYLWVGNYLPTKGHDILAEAFKIVHSKNSNAHLYFVGNIVKSMPNYIKTKKIVDDAGLQDYVHFMGQQSNPYVWMKYCDCFVLPSRLEGLPNVLLEAMYLRRPVVASVCVPVIDRMVKEGYNGYKVRPEQPVAMAEAMEKALLLNNFELTFKTATKEDFVNLFK